MASKLTQWINASLKNKGMTAKQAQKNAGKYKSIKAAQKAGSLYYKDKNGKIMIAAYAEDLKNIPKVKPKSDSKIESRKLSPASVGKGRGDGDYETIRRKIDNSKKPTNSKPAPNYVKTKRDPPPVLKRTAKIRKTTGDGTGDPYNSGKTKVAEKAPRPEKNKGGPVTKKPKGAYAAGGMPMVMKGGKKVPAFAADGKGKMNKGGMAVAKKKPAAKKMMAGGMTKKSGYMYGGMAKKKAKK